MNAAEIKQAYANALKETITVRRYSGTGASRPHADYTARGKATFYAATELTATILQGDRRVIIYADDLGAAGLTLPVTTADRIVADGSECTIIVPGTRKAPDGTLVVYDFQVRG